MGMRAWHVVYLAQQKEHGMLFTWRPEACGLAPRDTNPIHEACRPWVLLTYGSAWESTLRRNQFSLLSI
jgi:hypothetical protein